MSVFDGIAAVAFDVGGTLIDPWPSVGSVYAAVASEHGVTGLDPEALNRRFAAEWKAKRNFDYSRGAWAELVAKTFHGPAEPLRPVPFFEALYDRFSEPEVWRIHEDVLPAFENLLVRGLKLALISNWDERLRPLLDRLKLDSYFEAFAISSEIGFSKPSPVIFEEAVRKLGLPAGAILHVGDSHSEDLEGARGAGLRSILLDRKADRLPGESIRSLCEVEVLIS
jgi:putative hydrolase of the HAD superfamily